MPFSSLSPELLEAVLQATCIGLDKVDQRRLLDVQRVSHAFRDAAKRLMFRHVVISSPAQGAALLRSLRSDARLGPLVRTLIVKKSAFTQLSTFSDLSLDDIIRACPGLQLLDSPVATFAPLRDGRAPMASYPRTLRHFRLASTLTEGGEDSDSDDEYGSSSDSGMPTTFKVLEELPSDLKSLKLERSRAFDGSDRSADFPLRSLQSLEVTFTSAFKENIEWVLAPSVHSGTLTDLKLWCVRGMTWQESQEILISTASTLKSLAYKPGGHAVTPSTLPHLPVIERLTLGDNPYDVFRFDLAPSTLKTLCLAVPNGHDMFNLRRLITELGSRGRLQQLRRLELYSQVYFPSPEVVYTDDYSPAGLPPLPALRELRLSHVRAESEHMTRLFTLVGSNLRSLSLHHLDQSPATLVPHCPSLRRLEIGACHTESPDFFAHIGPQPLLHLLRVHFQSGVPLVDLIRAVKSKRLPSLKLIDIAGRFPENVEMDWTGAGVDELMLECKSAGVEVAINGRPVRTVGDLFGAVLAHARGA